MLGFTATVAACDEVVKCCAGLGTYLVPGRDSDALVSHFRRSGGMSSGA